MAKKLRFPGIADVLVHRASFSSVYVFTTDNQPLKVLPGASRKEPLQFKDLKGQHYIASPSPHGPALNQPAKTPDAP